MQLHDVWFVLIAFLWAGYFFLEGFDFGIGVLTRLLARDEHERGVLLATIGPVWDGNEVWMLTAVGATFAAFPDWYATLCSGFYLPILAVLVCLIVRGVAIEYRAKRDDARWRRTCDRCVFWSSLGSALLWGGILADMVHGVPIDANGNFAGTVLDLLNPYAALGALVTLLLFTFHGALFAALKTSGAVRDRARGLARKLGGPTGLVTLGFLFWIHHHMDGRGDWTLIVAGVVGAALFLAGELNERARDGWAFALSGVAVVGVVASTFLALFPVVLPSSLQPAWGLTVTGAASSDHTLTILTWVAAFMAPVVIAYQAWTYWVFRRRVSGDRAEAERPVGGGATR
ncbi:cytochrome d ubiquinol oxidase subunit II [Streptomyces sp. NBC_01304]|uniref:cytochrome d ubiquinol oxidase subunit II n=1 Tax=Streptomyces sp. NBC_01304 TaxID=2903818 RepID=UPI002E0ED26A|nr:cytochrome d ubiquinol oxidase subunit II [Streptomyces sp. NBC_01304]